MQATIELEPIIRLTRDLKQAAEVLSPDEARYLVDSYYAIQDYRKAAANQKRALVESGEPHAVIVWLHGQMETMENQIKRALDAWTDQHEESLWAKSITGIGPVISAGLLAHIDITKAPTVGHIWRFAGLDPTVKWEKKTKRPWNASLKVLTWKIGQSFMKFQNNSNDFYGKLYVQRKVEEVARNESGALAAEAERALSQKKYGKDTIAYASYIAGKLPPAHIDARARRWVTKLFLAHYHGVAYQVHYGEAAPKPYVLSVLGHGHEIRTPNWG